MNRSANGGVDAPTSRCFFEGADAGGVRGALRSVMVEINHAPPVAGTSLFDWNDEARSSTAAMQLLLLLLSS